MALNGIIFDARNNASKDWRNILKKILPDGILRGCNISYTSNSITVGDGYLVACGGVVQCDGTETLAITPQLANGYVRLKLRIDLSREASNTTSNQTAWAQDYSATTTFPDLTQEDITSNGLIYEIMVCIAQITGGNITGITQTAKIYAGPLSAAGGTLGGDLTLAKGAHIRGTQYGTDNPIDLIWLGNSANDNIWIGGNDGEATIGGGIFFHIGAGKEMRIIRGDEASVALLDESNDKPGTCTSATANQRSGGTHTHEIQVCGSATAPNQGSFYVRYSAEDHVTRVAGYRDTAKNTDYAQLAIVSNETGTRVNSVDVYPDAVEIKKDLNALGNINANGSVNLFGDESRLNGKNYAGDTVRLIRLGINEYDNLWIGTGDTTKESVSHAGNTYISAGRGGKLYAVLKKTNADGSEYEIVHTGNAASLLGGTFAASGHEHAGIERSGAGRIIGMSSAGDAFRTYDTSWGIVDNVATLGSATGRWKQLFAATSTISTSDARMKEEIADIDGAKELILKLKPRQFKRTDGESGRLHYGMVAQEVKEAMTAAGIDDFGGYVRSPIDDNGDPKTEAEENVRYGLRYEEFIAPLIATVQAQQKQIEELTKRMEILEGAK